MPENHDASEQCKNLRKNMARDFAWRSIQMIIAERYLEVFGFDSEECYLHG